MITIRWKFLVLIAVFTVLELEGSDVPEVTLSQGRVLGTVLRTSNGKYYEAFLGIPYARSPVGDLRFQEPLPALPWTGAYNASKYGNDCIQYSHTNYKVEGSEDCLYINVFRLKTERNYALKDVIVHIHGGAFQFLSGRNFESTKLIEEDFIYITLNYRLGPLGFMSTGDSILPGNLGLKDQVAALKWIKKDIARFGGDPFSVTITGLSAGGVSVHYHYLSPLSRGLFHRGISASGAVLNPWALSKSAPGKTKKMAALLGCPTSNSVELVNCLKKLPAEQIVKQVPHFMKFLYNPFTPFGPVVEPAGTLNPFLPRHPHTMLKDGEVSWTTPWLVGLTTDEGLYPAAEFIEEKNILDRLEREWTDMAPHLLDYNFTIGDREFVAASLRNHYFPNKTIPNAVTELVQLVGDRLFATGIAQSALMHAALPATDVHMYRFGYRGKHSLSEQFSHSTVNHGVSHADDCGYVMDFLETGETSSDRQMQKRMVHLWTSFARTGVPEFFEGSALPAVKDGLPKLKYLEIRTPTNASEEVVDELGNLAFWSKLPLKEEFSVKTSWSDYSYRLP